MYMGLGLHSRNVCLTLRFTKHKQCVRDIEFSQSQHLSKINVFSKIGCNMLDRDLEKEISRLQRYKKKAEQKNDLKEVAHILNQLGELLSQNGNYTEAIEEHERERIISEGLGDKIGEAVACRKIGECHCALAQYDKALEFQHQHLVLAQECRDQVEVQRALATIGRTHLCQAETQTLKLAKLSLDKAEHSFIKALETCEMLKSSSKLTQSEYMSMKGRLFLNLGLVHDARGAEKEAAEYLKRALAIAEKYCLEEEQYLCHINMAVMYQRSNNPSMALRSLTVALATATKLNLKHNQGEVYLQMAVVNVTVGNYGFAKHCLKKAHKILSTSEDTARITKLFKAVTLMESAMQGAKSGCGTLNMFHAFEQLGDALSAMDNFTEAIRYYQKMLSCGEHLKLPAHQLVPAYVSLAQTFADNKQPDFAIACYQKELQLREKDNEQACLTWLNIADQEEIRGDGYPELHKSYNSAFSCALKARKPHLQAKVLRMLAAVQKSFGQDSDLQETTLKLQQLQADYRLKLEDELTDEETDKESIDETDGDGHNSLSDLTSSESSEEEEDILSPVASGTASARRTSRIDKVNDKGETPLHIACIKGNLKRVRTLLSERHPVNVRDNCGWTPLHEAANNNHYAIVEALLEAGADINDRGGIHCNGITPLIDAASCGNLEIIQLLVDMGANVLAEDSNGAVASQALQDWHERVAETLDKDTITQYHATLRLLQDREKSIHTVMKSKATTSSQRNKPSDAQSSTSHNENRTSLRQHRQTSISKKASEINAVLTERSLRKERWSDVHKNLFQTEAVSNEEDAIHLYRSAISSVGNSTQALVLATARCHKAQMSPQSTQALIREDELVGDDWLIDDLQTARHKRGRMRDKLSASCSYFHKGKRARLSLTGRSSRTNKRNILSVENSITNDYKDDDRTISSPLGTANESEEESIEQVPSLLPLSSSGEQSTEASSFKSFSCLAPLEVQEDAFENVLENNYLNTSHSGQSQSTHAQDSILRIKVKIEGSIFLIPTAVADQRTFGWLSEEASQRYSSYCGRCPRLTFSSSDGALLSPNDIIAMVLSDNDLIEGVVNSWDQSSLSERYLQACRSCHTVYRNILAELKQAESCNILRLADLALSPLVLQPAIMALQAQTSLKELHLPGNDIGDTGLEWLVQVLPDLPNLHTLNLEDNGITAQGFAYLVNLTVVCTSKSSLISLHSRPLLPGSSNVRSPHDIKRPLQGLRTLKMSHNSLGNEIADSLCTILDKLVSLEHLCLNSCRLTSKLLFASNQNLCAVLQRCSLRHLEISHNSLDKAGIELLLSCLKQCPLVSLDIANTVLDTNRGQCAFHLQDFQAVSHTLERLSVAGCQLDTEEVIIIRSLPQHCPHLRYLNVSFNAAVTTSCLQNLLWCSTQSPSSRLQHVEAMSCALTSPLGTIFMSAIADKLASDWPLHTFKFSCQHLEEREQSEISHLWTQRWSHAAKVLIRQGCVLLTVDGILPSSFQI
ncbi:tonsoku-like protein isoform X2 [Pomacea canaliculata]|uniref:tonsoku-like protein isoform X2 n=1 Tax=Pomacea canaliculata TaxID=400727 RepID=UPI000D73C6D1|nr:tonsoku-like protein isoform X2 [Pomacea canaliculata]